MQNPAAAAGGGPQTDLDFWLGRWQAVWDGGEGTNTITRILDGGVIYEEFDGRPGMNLQGRSYSLYDRRLGRWRQTWVDNEEGFLNFVGGRHGDTFLLELSRIAEQEPYARMVFLDIKLQSFTWRWQKSPDQGKSWSTAWEIRYRRMS
jgi:hypothetical protein